MFNSNSSDTLGFINLESKKDQLLPILKHYEFISVVRAVFTINSWRNNRGAQESCLALNLAISSIDSWGGKVISTYSDFSAFFDEIYSILKTSNYDDPVLCDFGEIKLALAVIMGHEEVTTTMIYLHHAQSIYSARHYQSQLDKVLNS